MQDKTEGLKPLAEGEVRPQDDVTVYATAKLVDAGIASAVGDPIVVHSAIAKKLVAGKKATEEAPKGKKEKEATA